MFYNNNEIIEADEFRDVRDDVASFGIESGWNKDIVNGEIHGAGTAVSKAIAEGIDYWPDGCGEKPYLPWKRKVKNYKRG